MVLIICLGVLIALTGSMLAGGVYAWKKANNTVNEIYYALGDYVTPDQDGNSKFGQVVNNIATIQAQYLNQSLQAALRGQMGGAISHALLPALDAEAIERAQKDPEVMAAALQEVMPKGLKKSPAGQIIFQQIVGQFLSKLNTGTGAKSSPGNNGKSEQVKFNF